VQQTKDPSCWNVEVAPLRLTLVTVEWLAFFDPKIGIRRVATNKDKDKLQIFGLYLNMYEEKWKIAVIKHEED
jgi:hypothetical protein